jgi:DNA-binding PadR family transcriptional regulator
MAICETCGNDYDKAFQVTMNGKAHTTTWYYILLSLAPSDRHGLAVAREVLALSDGQVRLWPAMLYGALEDLSDRGWIEEVTDARRRPDESERKRYYRITRAGRAAAVAETHRLAGLVRVARARVKPRAGETS